MKTEIEISKFFQELYDMDGDYWIKIHDEKKLITIRIQLFGDATINFHKIQKVAEFFGTTDFNISNKHERVEYSEYTVEENDYVIYQIEKSKIVWPAKS